MDISMLQISVAGLVIVGSFFVYMRNIRSEIN